MSAHWRSYLFVPGDRPELFAKARASGAHVVIIDLEDAVPAADKAAARASIATWLSPNRHVLVRVNAADTEWFAEDAAMCRHPGVAGVVLPKTQTTDQPAALAARVGSRMPVLPLIETRRAYGMR
jgi:citrate lyase subunit beta/citryl-CoA lyase